MSFIGCIFLGAPGSGKGTQAKNLESFLNIPHISTGDMLRAEIGMGSPLGKRVKEILDAGILVDDKLITEVVTERFSKPDIRSGYILDGYPRTLEQAEAFEKILTSLKLPPPQVIFFALPTEALKSRLLGRLTCPTCGAVYHRDLNPPKKDLICDLCGFSPVQQRKDDTEDTVVKRLEVFENETSSLRSYYAKSGRLVTIDASKEVSEISDDLKKILTSASL